MSKILPWLIVGTLLLTGGIGASCGRAALKASQARADSALTRAAIDSTEAAHAEAAKAAILRERDSLARVAVTASNEAERLRRRNREAIAALPQLPDTCKPALLLVDSLRVEADSQGRAAAHWKGVHVKDSLAAVKADEAMAAERKRANDVIASLRDLRRVSARDPDRWILGIPRPRVVVGVGIQADPFGRVTSGVQVTAGIPIF